MKVNKNFLTLAFLLIQCFKQLIHVGLILERIQFNVVRRRRVSSFAWDNSFLSTAYIPCGINRTSSCIHHNDVLRWNFQYLCLVIRALNFVWENAAPGQGAHQKKDSETTH